MKPFLGTCYYPEHWPQTQWQNDAKRMVDLGLTVVRIGEFAWSRLEPTPDKLQWHWLDEAIEILGSAGLQIILGTPSATPPRWMIEKHPDMLAIDINNQPRKFGSRRHYCFSHDGYLNESVRIAQLMAERYGKSEYLAGWQIDNEYGCHDTTVSYSKSALNAFQKWLKQKYQSIDKLNEAWGNVFWSMEYNNFDQIDLPNLTVTEANPSHCLDFRRFSSDQVVRYNRAQVDVIRPLSDAPLIHNYMGRVTDFDHYAVGDDLDIASWDSYPLGFLVDRSGTDDEWKQRFSQQGDPDFQAFHHDLYRAIGKGRWWVMEQQPGSVNWAPNNPAPLPGMVRLWTLEAIAHEAEAVCYFRWRQAPFAQEQMHAGLLRPDSENSATFPEVEQVSIELNRLGDIKPYQSKVALIFDYESCWAWEIQPQGEDFNYFKLIFDFYRGLRRLGLSVDIIPPNCTKLADYSFVLAPGLMYWPAKLLEQIENHSGVVLLGPRSGSRTENFTIPENMPPNISQLDCKVSYTETFSTGSKRPLKQGGFIQTWFEKLEGTFDTLESLEDDSPILVANNHLHYIASWPDAKAMQRILKSLTNMAGVTTTELPEGVRIRETASHRFIFNYNNKSVSFEEQTLPAAGVIWKHS